MVIEIDSIWIYYIAVTLLLAVIGPSLLKLASAPKNEQCKKKYSGVDVLQFLQEIKPIPVVISTGWKLCGFQHGHRIWRNELQSPLLGGQAILHASYSKIKGSSQNLLNTLKDAARYPEWHIGVHKVKYMTMAPELDSNNKNKSKNTMSTPVLNDVISLETDVSSSQMIQFINKMSQKIQGDSLIRRIELINRYWHKEDKECSWLLEMKEESLEWTLYLIQSIEGLFELDQCMLNVIHCQSLNEENDIDVLPALRLGCLLEFMLYRKVQCAPLPKLTLPIGPESRNDKEPTNESMTPGGSPTKTPHKTILDELKSRAEDKTESNFIKRVRNFVEERKEWYEERKKKNSLVPVSKSSSTSQSPRGSIDDRDSFEGELGDNVSTSSEREEIDTEEFTEYMSSQTSQEKASKEIEPETCSEASQNGETGLTEEVESGKDICERETGETNEKLEKGESALEDLVAMDEIEVIDPSEIDSLVPLSEPVTGGKGNAKQRLLKFLKSSSFSSFEESQRKEPSPEEKPEEKPEESKMGKIKLRLMQKMRSLDLDAFKDKDDKSEVDTEESTSHCSEIESDIPSSGVDGPLTEEERLEAEYLDIADKAASELLLEKMHIANIEISRSYEEQATMTGGWIYCGLEKEVVILRKIYKDGIPFQSYMGKGLIPVAPKTVFEAVSNPRTRCIYDEMLKKIDILHEFDNGMKIVHMHHEVSQLFRKEPRDFCVLQSERIEGVKYLISLQSVDWPECSETDDVPRAKIISSGWIIEPAMKDKKLFTMVTYITQMELGLSKLNTGYLVEELAAKQPLSIYHLRQYLAPSAIPSRPSPMVARTLPSTSSSHTRPRNVSSTLAATAAAAGLRSGKTSSQSEFSE